jgi:hypothetical protein
MAASNDIKSAQHLRTKLVEFTGNVDGLTPAEFQKEYDQLLISLQYDLSTMAPTPVVSLAAAAIERREHATASR